MRDIRNGVCPLCEHDEIVEGIPAEFTGANEAQSAFTYDPRLVFDGRNSSQPQGLLHYFMCRRCGYLQWFVSDPSTVPIDLERRTRLVPRTGRTEGPFR